MAYNQNSDFNTFEDIAGELRQKGGIYFPPYISSEESTYKQQKSFNDVFYRFRHKMVSQITDIELRTLNFSSKQEFKECDHKKSMTKAQVRYLFASDILRMYIIRNRDWDKDPSINQVNNFFDLCGEISNIKASFITDVAKQKNKEEEENQLEITANSLNEIIDTISEYWYGSNIYDTFKDGDEYTSLLDLAKSFNTITKNISDKQWEDIIKKLNPFYNGKSNENLLDIYGFNPMHLLDEDRFYSYLSFDS